MATASEYIHCGKLAKELCLAIKIDKPVTALRLDLGSSGKVVVAMEFILDAKDTNRLMDALKQHREANPE